VYEAKCNPVNVVIHASERFATDKVSGGGKVVGLALPRYSWHKSWCPYLVPRVVPVQYGYEVWKLRMKLLDRALLIMTCYH
jgi:hypothetical protein